jgi:RNA recognition motif-containing protein
MRISSQAVKMSNRLLIGNLSLETVESTLNDLFSSVGNVRSVALITDLSGKRKGFAFVEMASNSEAQTAIKLLDGADMDGRFITVNLTEPSQQNSPLSLVAKFMRLLRTTGDRTTS